MTTRGFDADDFELLASLDGADSVDEEIAGRADDAWDRIEAVLRDAAIRAGEPGLAIELWPWGESGAPSGFVWARMKRPELDDHASHLGLFLAPAGCNISLDLEKDRIENGTARESLEDVLAFYRDAGRPALAAVEDPEVRIWTDADNEVALEDFLDEEFERFMSRNRDEEHPWPKLGYRLQADRLAARPDDQVRLFASRLGTLVPVYDALVGSFDS